MSWRGRGEEQEAQQSVLDGGRRGHFEASVQACFVTLILTGGYAPALPRWPIVEVKLQGKVDGFETDDLIIHVQNPSTGERRKLLAQLKHAVAFTAGNEVLGQVLHGAWIDFNNSSVFSKGKDAIALITGRLAPSIRRTSAGSLSRRGVLKTAMSSIVT